MISPSTHLTVRAFLGSCLLACQDNTAELRQPVAMATPEPAFDFTSVALSGRVTAANLVTNQYTPLEGVEVCVESTTNCTQSIAKGEWLLPEVDPSQQVTLRFEKPGHVTVYQSLVTPEWSARLGATYLMPSEGHQDAFNAARIAAGLDALPSDDGLGSISFSAFLPGTIYLDPAIHVRVEPDYGGVEPLYDLAVRSGFAVEVPEDDAATWGIFLNVPPRDSYDLVYTMDKGECSFYESELGGWPAEDGRSNVVRIPVFPDGVTFLVAPSCVRDTDPQPN
jgi:hypothetical protein